MAVRQRSATPDHGQTSQCSQSVALRNLHRLLHNHFGRLFGSFSSFSCSIIALDGTSVERETA